LVNNLIIFNSNNLLASIILLFKSYLLKFLLIDLDFYQEDYSFITFLIKFFVTHEISEFYFFTATDAVTHTLSSHLQHSR